MAGLGGPDARPGERYRPEASAAHKLGLALLNHLGIDPTHVLDVEINMPSTGTPRGGSRVEVRWQSIGFVSLPDLAIVAQDAEAARVGQAAYREATDG